MDEQDERGRIWLFENSYKENEKQPSKTGNGEISVEFLRQLVAKAKSDPKEETVKIRVAAWPRTSKAGRDYDFIKMEMPREETQPATVESTSAPRNEEIEPF